MAKIDDLLKLSNSRRAPTAASVTHIAGPVLTWDGRYIRQRCSWCGAVLIDVDITRLRVVGDDRDVATWPFEAFVRCSGGSVSSVVKGGPVSEDPLAHAVPHDCCMLRDPAETA